MKDFRQSENVCDFLSLHEAVSNFSHYVMPAQSNKKLLFLHRMEIESNNEINAPLAQTSTLTTSKCTEYCTGLLRSAFSTSLKQSSYVVLPKVNVETQTFCTFCIYGPKRSLFNKLDVMNHRDFSYLLLFPSVPVMCLFYSLVSMSIMWILSQS